MARHFTHTHLYIWYSFYFITTILVQPCHLTELAPLRPHIGVFTKCMVRVSICVEFGAKRMTTSCRAPVYLCSFCQECRFSQCPQMDRAWTVSSTSTPKQDAQINLSHEEISRTPNGVLWPETCTDWWSPLNAWSDPWWVAVDCSMPSKLTVMVFDRSPGLLRWWTLLVTCNQDCFSSRCLYVYTNVLYQFNGWWMSGFLG